MNSSGMVPWITVHLSIYFMSKSKADTCSLTLHRLLLLPAAQLDIQTDDKLPTRSCFSCCWNGRLWDGFSGELLAIGFAIAPSVGEKLVFKWKIHSNV